MSTELRRSKSVHTALLCSLGRTTRCRRRAKTRVPERRRWADPRIRSRDNDSA